MAITLVAPQVRGSFASAEFPYRSRGYWLHVYMPDDLIDEILKDFENLLGTEAVSIFLFCCCGQLSNSREPCLTISVLADGSTEDVSVAPVAFRSYNRVLVGWTETVYVIMSISAVSFLISRNSFDEYFVTNEEFLLSYRSCSRKRNNSPIRMNRILSVLITNM